MTSPALRARSRHHHAGTVEKARSKRGNGAQNWMHLAAMNLIAEHEAGGVVDPVRLEAARNITARAHLAGAAA